MNVVNAEDPLGGDHARVPRRSESWTVGNHRLVDRARAGILPSCSYRMPVAVLRTTSANDQRERLITSIGAGTLNFAALARWPPTSRWFVEC
jgi:hypothetical protein